MSGNDCNQDQELLDLIKTYATVSTSAGGETWTGDPGQMKAVLRHILQNDLTNQANGGPLRPSMSRIRMGWIK